MYVITFHFSVKLRNFCSTVSVLELKHMYLLHLYNSSHIYLVLLFNSKTSLFIATVLSD